MKTFFVLAVFIAMVGLELPDEKRNLPIDGWLPNVSGEWIRRDDRGAKGDHSWATYDNKDMPGDVLSFSMTKVPPAVNVSSSSVNQASIETFRADGSSVFSSRRPSIEAPAMETVRHRTILINLGSTTAKRDIEALEYTYIYEPSHESKRTMAHGYGVVVEGNALFVQHTSSRVISSEVAFDMLVGMLSRHHKLAGKPIGYSKGKILKSNG